MVGISDSRSPFGPTAQVVDASTPGMDAAATVLGAVIALQAMRVLLSFLEGRGLFGPCTQGAIGDYLAANPQIGDPASCDGVDRDALVELVMSRLADPRRGGGLCAPQLGQAAPAGTLRAGELQRIDDTRLAAKRSAAEPRPSPVARAEAPAPSGPAQVVPAQKTPLSGSEAREAIRTAWVERYGSEPSERTLAVLTSQWALETGHGRSMMNYNFGGIKGTGPSGLTTEYGTREGWGATEVRTRARFRAYRSASEGAADYLALLDRRYPEAMSSARDGDPDGFVHALKRRGYFTGNEDAYVRSVRSMTQQALAQGFDTLGARAVA